MLKRKSVLLTISAIILFAILAVAVNIEIFNGFENWFYEETVGYMCEGLTFVSKCITHLGGPIGITLVCIAIYLIPRTRLKVALPVSVSVSSAFVLNVILKRIFSRERPNILRLVNESSYSFPSGHAMVNAALYATLAVYAYKLIDRRRIKWPVIVAVLTLIVLIGLTRIYLGVHYAGDIMAGWLLGFAVAMTTYTVIEKLRLNDDDNEEE